MYRECLVEAVALKLAKGNEESVHNAPTRLERTDFQVEVVRGSTKQSFE